MVRLVHHAIIQQGHQSTPGGVEGIGVEVCSQTWPQGGIQFRGNRFRRDGQHHASGVMDTQAGALQHPADIHRGHLVPAQREAQEEHRLIVGPGELDAHDVGYRVGQRIDDGRRRDQFAVPGVAQRRQEKVHQDGVAFAKGLDHRPVSTQDVAGLRLDRAPHLLGGHCVMQQQLWFQMTEARHEIELVLGVLRGDHHLHAAVHQGFDVGCQVGFRAEHPAVVDADSRDPQVDDAGGPRVDGHRCTFNPLAPVADDGDFAPFGAAH